MSFKKHLENFAANTSMHGLGKVILTKKPEKRIAWVIVFLSAWALFSYQLYSVLSSYLKYAKKTTSEFIPGGAPFPSITLCNMQSLDFYTMHLLFTANLEFDWNAENESFAEFVGRDVPLAYELAKWDDLLRNYYEVLDATEFYQLYSRTTISSNLKKEIVTEGAVSEEEFIVDCTFGNSKCRFKAIDHPYYYRCFTFEPYPSNKSSNYDSLAEGIANGFSATLFTGTKLLNSTGFQRLIIPGIYEKGSPLAGSAGIRMVIHPPGTVPFPLTEGYDVPTGYLASIGIIPQKRTRLGKPYGECDTKNKYHKNTLEQQGMAEDEGHKPYRKISCERTCMQEHVMKECGCFDPYLPNPGDTICLDGKCIVLKSNESETDKAGEVDKSSELPDYDVTFLLTCRSVGFLDASEASQNGNVTGIQMLLDKIACAENVTNRMMTVVSDLAACGCHPPCDEYHYSVSYSLSRWPSMGFESSNVHSDIFNDHQFVDRFSEAKKKVYDEYVKKEGVYALKDFAKINVYVADSNVMQTTEHPATTLTQMVSEIGGQLGLWIGVSVITISEVIETILTVISGACRRLGRRCKAKDDGSDEKDIEKGSKEGSNNVTAVDASAQHE